MAHAEEPSVPPPEEWRGIKFGLGYDVAKTAIDSLFETVAASDTQIVAKVTINGNIAEVKFDFPTPKKELLGICYEINGSSLDIIVNALSALKMKYGEPTKTIPLDSKSMHYEITTWAWKNPSFVLSASECFYHITEPFYKITISYDRENVERTKAAKEAAEAAAKEY
jgi:hypothetical protein